MQATATSNSNSKTILIINNNKFHHVPSWVIMGRHGALLITDYSYGEFTIISRTVISKNMFENATKKRLKNA